MNPPLDSRKSKEIPGVKVTIDWINILLFLVSFSDKCRRVQRTY